MHAMVIFGATGDLTSRKLVPALYRLHCKDRLPPDTVIVGVARTPHTHEAWRERLADSTAKMLGEKFVPSAWNALADRIFYHPGDVSREQDIRSLKQYLDTLPRDADSARVYYLAMAPEFYETTIAQLGQQAMTDPAQGPCRVVIEKPFGRDLASARRLNEAAHRVFDERQIFRIDHYLGKETVQNILVLRFANTIFEPVWNRNYIDHVQITAAEEVVVGRRGGYYDRSGVLRDMFQNHLLQLLTITAMEAPSRFEADAVRNEKVKVLGAVRPMTAGDVAKQTVRAQYRGYTDEPDVPSGSQTATFAAVALYIDNWRWQGVPFLLRSGKALDCRTTQIVIQFRQPPHILFDTQPRQSLEANRLVIHIQPAEGIQLHFQTKVPDAGMHLRLTDLDFRFDRRFDRELPDAYERLLLDVLHGDASLFARADEVEFAWSIIDPISAAWEQTGEPPLCVYDRGIWGPEASREWIARGGRQWLDVCPVLK